MREGSNHSNTELQDKNILYICAYMSKSMEKNYDISHSLAANNHIQGIVRSFHAGGSNVTIISPIWRESSTPIERQSQIIFDEELGVEVHVPRNVGINFFSGMFLTLFTTINMISELSKSNYDAVFFYNFYIETAMPALIGSTIYNIPLYIEFLDSYLHRGGLRQQVRKYLFHRICGLKLAGAVCVSTTLERLVPVDNNTVVLRGFPSIGFPDSLTNRDTVEADSTVITFAGRFDDLRGIYSFLEICESVSTTHADIEFWICGYGPKYQEVNERAENMHESVKFLGTLRGDTYTRRIVSSDVLVNFQDPTMPDSNYVFPSKLLDYMSAGKIILSTPVSDVPEHLGHIINITEGDTDSIERDLIDIIENIEEYQSKSRRGPEWINQNCKYKYAAKRLDEIMK